MSRKLSLILIFTTLALVLIFDLVMFLHFSGSLEKITHSIQKFDTLYSQDFRMNQQLSFYSKKLRSHAVTLSNLKKALMAALPSAKFKISRSTLALSEPTQVDPIALLNVLGEFTNVNVIEISMKSLTPINYVGFEYKSGFISYEHVILEKFVVRVYGG